MKGRSFILRCTAFFLILVFSQKSGAGLFLHSLLHSPKTISEFPVKENEKGKGLEYACACMDDFLMPFDEATEPVCSLPVLTPAIPFTFFEGDIPFHTSIFSFLRGPPAA
jgi:hypothetical protein